MSSGTASEVKLEIGHVLFIDIQLKAAAELPTGITYGELKSSPDWNSLRGDPRFDQIVASLAPKTVQN
jgi:hypothetical protein